MHVYIYTYTRIYQDIHHPQPPHLLGHLPACLGAAQVVPDGGGLGDLLRQAQQRLQLSFGQLGSVALQLGPILRWRWGWGMDHTKTDVGNINIYQHGITKIVWELILYIKMELPAIGNGFLGDVTPVTNPFDLDEIAKHQLILSDLPGSPEACGNGKCPEENSDFTRKNHR